MSILEQYGINVESVKEKLDERFKNDKIVLTRSDEYLSADGYLLTMKTSNNDLPLDQIAIAAEKELGLVSNHKDINGQYLYVREL
ncbi:MAG: hypothetical protein KAG61_13505 [Bacteriovoracaceae bacterium]|nr:hypothetical protein [Bacteriovoracaceae bacterium]